MFTTVATHSFLRAAGALVLATAGLFSTGATTASAAAPTVIGYAARVICDADGHTLTITPYATGVANGVSQTIYYRYWILNRTTNQWVKGFSPTTWGQIIYTSGYREWDPFTQSWYTVKVPSASGTDFRILLSPGRYSVYTEYWGGGNAVLTTDYQYYLGGADRGSCRTW